MNFLVTGGRDYDNRAQAELVLSGAFQAMPDAVLVHGAATGLDSLAAEIWRELGGDVDPHPADWSAPCRDNCRDGHRRSTPNGSGYCPAAGVYRNREMLKTEPKFLLAFAGGRGTADMTEQAQRAGVLVLTVS